MAPVSRVSHISRNPYARLSHAPAGALAIFARSPVPGKAKTRLIPLLGERGAAEFQAALTSDALRKIRPLENRMAVVFMTTGHRFPHAASMGSAVSAVPATGGPSGNRPAFRVEPQRGRDLGQRLQHAFRKLLLEHSRVVAIGTDSPELSVRILLHAFRALLQSDAVLGPCPDGGYYLVGLRQRAGPGLAPGREPPGALFRGILWGTSAAFRDTMRNFDRHGLSCARLEPLEDIDRPEDLKGLKERMTASNALRRRAPATWQFLRQMLGDER
ncbi:MAG: TIGR04282 family arsenosugar biosynthesis glycosyltransferase [Terriglobia bacterium]